MTYEPIILTENEIAELEFEIAQRVPIGFNVRQILGAVFSKLNYMRAPLPLGTVRAKGDNR